MKSFLKRVLIVLTTGYILVYYGELVLWATPEREDLLGGVTIDLWLQYSLVAYVFLCVASVFNARNVWAVVRAGAFFGWFEEGVVMQTTCGTPDNSFPMSIAFTGLAWHALIGLFTGMVSHAQGDGVKQSLQDHRSGERNGIFFGFWAIYWWNEPPAPMKALLDAEKKGSLLVLLHRLSYPCPLLYNCVMPFVFKPGKLELWFFSVVTILYYAFTTVPVAPKALWVLQPLMATTFWALSKNRQVKSQADAISAFDAKVQPLNCTFLFVIPLIAVVIYFIGLVTDARLHTNMVVYYVFSTLGVMMWITSVVMVLRHRAATNSNDLNVLPRSIENSDAI